MTTKQFIEKEYYAPTFMDHSMSSRGKPTGDLHATIFTRVFTVYEQTNGKRVVRSKLGFHFPRWSKDDETAKASAIKKAIKGMKELTELDKNPPLDFLPDEIKRLKFVYAASAYQLSSGTILHNPKEKAFEAGKKAAVEYIKKNSHTDEMDGNKNWIANEAVLDSALQASNE